MTSPRRALGALLALGVMAISAAPSFAADQFPGFNGSVQAVTPPDANGIRYLGGSFTAYRPVDSGPTAPFDPTTGQVSTAFPKLGAGTSDSTAASAVEPDGQGGFYVAGAFTDNLVHLLADGTRDTGFTPPAVGGIEDLALAGGRLYATGTFTTVGGVSAQGLARFNATTGAVDATYTPTISPTYTHVYKMLVAHDRIYVTGQFSGVAVCGQSYTRTRIMALNASDGCMSNWDSPSIGDQSYHFGQSLTASADTVYVGGLFGTATGGNAGAQATARRSAAAFSATTGELRAWDPGFTDTSTLIVALQWNTANSSVYVGGQTNTGGVLTERDGITGAATAWSAPAVSGQVKAFHLTGTTLFVGGSITQVGGTAKAGLASLSTTTGQLTADAPFVIASGNTVQVNDIAARSGLSPLVMPVGRISQAGGQARGRLAAITPAGELTSWNPNANGEVTALALDGDRVCVAGGFSTVGGQNSSWAAAVTTAGQVLPWTTGITNTGLEYAAGSIMRAGDHVYVGGPFSATAGATTLKGLVRYTTSNLALDTSFTPQPIFNFYGIDFPGGVHSMVADADRIYIAGNFTTVGGTTRTRLAAVSQSNGSLVTAFDPGTIGARVRSVALSNGTLFAGGDFTAVTPAGGTSTPRAQVAAFDAPSGALLPWAPVVQSGKPVRAIRRLGANVVLTGDFSQITSQSGGAALTRNCIAQVDATSGDVTNWATTVPQPSQYGACVYGVDATDAGMFAVGGYDTGARPYIASLQPDGTAFPGMSYPWPPAPEPTPDPTPDPGGGSAGGSGSVSPSAGSASTPGATQPGTAGMRRLSLRGPITMTRGGRATGGTIMTSFVAPGPGTVRQVASAGIGAATLARGTARRTMRVCTTTATVPRAGTATITCPLTAAARVALTRRALTATIVTTFTTADGTRAGATRTIRLPRTAAAVTG